MNTVCAAGTGSFLDQQAARLGIPIEEFGSYALLSASPTHIAGRCTVFAETDMIHKQQMGHSLSDIIAGLCDALVRNYLSNVAKGKELLPPVVFQGGVAANLGSEVPCKDRCPWRLSSRPTITSWERSGPPYWLKDWPGPQRK